MEIKNPWWYKHVSLNEKQRKELEAYERKLQEPKEDLSYLNGEFTLVDSFEDVKDVTRSVEEEYVFDKDAMVF